MKYVMFIVAIVIGGGGLALAARLIGALPASVDRALTKAGQSAGLMEPDKLGWLDDSPLSESDRQRITKITGGGISDNGNTGHLGVIRRIQGGSRSAIGRRDVELLRQDRRRARAAYPDVDPDTLFRSAWFQIDFRARVPMDWNTSHNGDGIQGPDGKWYIDGGAYLSYVSPEYPNRASPEDTKQFYADLAAKRRAEKLARKEIWWSMGGTGGSLSVNCKDGVCVVRQADEWANKAKQYTFQFVAEEWLDDPGTMKKIMALPSFADAKIEEIDVEPNGTSIGFPITEHENANFVPYSPGMTLGPGQSTTIGIQLQVNRP